MAKLLEKRGFILACAAICCSFAGAVYMWSIFNQPLIDRYGWSMRAVSLTYSVYLVMSAFSGIAGGCLQERFDSAKLLLAAGILEAAGWFFAGFATSIPLLYLTFGVLGGLGDGLLYNVSVSVATRWFPDKHGFANGVCIGAVGLSSLVFAPLGNAFIEAFGAAGSFKLCGVIFLAFFLVFSRFVQAPPAGWTPGGCWTGGPGEAVSAGACRLAEVDLSGSQMLHRAVFWVLFVLFVAATTTGSLLSSQTSGIGQSLVGMTPAQGALMVGVLAIGGTAGRFGFGTLSDSIGRYSTMVAMLSVSGFVMLFLGGVHTFFGLAACLAVGGACFGGFMTVMPSLCADLFGNRHFGQNYALLYVGFTIGAFVGPLLAARSLDFTGGYGQAFASAAALSFAAIGLVLVARVLARRIMEPAA